MKHSILRHSVLFLLLFARGSGLWAQVPSGYYNNANGKTGDELKTALHDIIKGHTTIDYSDIWDAFWSTDNKGDGVVWDMYSDIPNGTSPYTFSMGQNQCGSYDSEGDCYNREHSWPESWFGSQNTPRTDLHHIFPTDGYVNNQRSSYPFGEVSTASWTSQNGSKLGTCKSSLGYNGTVFEPIDEYKGDFARALMYMSVRYYTEDDGWSTNAMTNKSVILPWAIEMLLNWNESDPVSQKEIDRNNVIYNDYQHNRNPFIDNPEYARMIWDPNWHGGGNVGTGDFVKVTTEPTDWSGDYLIVYENGGKAFNGALSTLDANNNTISVTISNNQINSSDETNAAIFTIASITGGYSIKSSSGKYIGYSGNSNGLTASTTALLNTISLSNGSVIIQGSGTSTLQYNSSADRFRYYSSTQNVIQLYKKIETYTITLSTVEHGSISANDMEASEGTIITLTSTPDEGYELDYWSVTDANSNVIAVNNNQFVMPASNVTVSATFIYVGQPFEQKYYLVTSTDQLIAGRTYLIVNTEYAKALGKTQNSNNRSAASVTITNNSISALGDACELTLGGQAGAWTFYDATNNSGYLYAAGGNNDNNYLKTQTTLTNAGKWAISLNSNNIVTIKTIDSNVNRHTIMYNNSSNLFSCYASGQKSVCLFIRGEEFDHTQSESIAQLFPFDKHTVQSGVTLTVTGAANCTEPSYLILEDGAQLIHNADGVQATVKKSITPYSGNDNGWHFIASPVMEGVTPSAGNGLLSGTYDLYYYDEPTHHWMNYKLGNTNSGFNLAHKQGYLYANSAATTLQFVGTLSPSNAAVSVTGLSHSAAILNGFNLIGNPFACNATVNQDCYVIDGNQVKLATTNPILAPCEGVMVKADSDTYTATFSKHTGAKANANSQCLDLVITKGGASTNSTTAVLDRARVRLGEGIDMEKFNLDNEHTQISFWQDGQDFAVVYAKELNELPVIFKVTQNGTYTISIENKGLDLEYLHLIDNLTGADIDLLQTPEYVFNARTSDYASRFRLVFSANDEGGASTGSATFAFVSNGEIVINGATDNATLQIIDVMGRVIVSREAVRHISTSGIPAGVYVLRLVKADGVRVQKIVID